jgi:hypothetical protein
MNLHNDNKDIIMLLIGLIIIIIIISYFTSTAAFDYFNTCNCSCPPNLWGKVAVLPK